MCCQTGWQNIKKKKLPATDGADQLLAGNRYLFPTMMIDCFNLPTRGCSAPEPATDGNNAPLPLKSPCAAPVAPSCPCLTNNPHYEGYMMSQRERAREISMHQATFSWYQRGWRFNKQRINTTPRMQQLHKAPKSLCLQRVLFQCTSKRHDKSTNNLQKLKKCRFELAAA